MLQVTILYCAMSDTPANGYSVYVHCVLATRLHHPLPSQTQGVLQRPLAFGEIWTAACTPSVSIEHCHFPPNILIATADRLLVSEQGSTKPLDLSGVAGMDSPHGLVLLLRGLKVCAQ